MEIKPLEVSDGPSRNVKASDEALPTAGDLTLDTSCHQTRGPCLWGVPSSPRPGHARPMVRPNLRCFSRREGRDGHGVGALGTVGTLPGQGLCHCSGQPEAMSSAALSHRLAGRCHRRLSDPATARLCGAGTRVIRTPKCSARRALGVASNLVAGTAGQWRAYPRVSCPFEVWGCLKGSPWGFQGRTGHLDPAGEL